MRSFSFLDWRYLLIGLAALLSISFHELCHGLAAYKLGDPTAKQLGRLTLNPIKHIDIFGLIMLIVAGFGWAKPVPVDMRYFRDPRSGMAITALAGPASNMILALLALFIRAALRPFDGTVIGIVSMFLLLLANISVGLGIFNIIPIPPLDGSKILLSILPKETYYTVLRYERLGMVALLILLNLGIFSPFLNGARDAVISILWLVANSPFNAIYGSV